MERGVAVDAWPALAISARCAMVCPWLQTCRRSYGESGCPGTRTDAGGTDLGDHAVLVDRLSRALDEALPLIPAMADLFRRAMPPIWTNFASCATKAVNISLPCRRATQTTPASRR